MKVLFLTLIVAFVFAERIIHEDELATYTFEQYAKDFEKVYVNDLDREVHELIFARRLAEAIEHNKGDHSYTKGINRFSDMTEAEFSRYRGYKPSVGLGASPQQPCDTTQVKYPQNFPQTVDWRQANPPVLSPVKDQGNCGSCWAFATTETIEAALAIATKNLTVLSPQDVVSCTPNPYNCGGTGGCNGAIAELGFDWVKNNGIAANSAWPYTATNGQCTPHTMMAKVAGCNKLKENNYTDLMAAVATIGPIAVSVDASTWGPYKGGIYSGCDKENTMDIDHAVQLVGYGMENTTPYWIVRNSWGPNWGEKGYIRLLRHTDGSSKWCKSDVTPSDGSGCDGGPSTITVCGECGIWYDNSYPYGASYV
jgi:cathepsin L